MGLSLEEAMDIAAMVPARRRVLIARGADVEHADWIAGNIDDIATLTSQDEPDLGRHIRDRISEFERSESQASISLWGTRSRAVVFMVLGASSAEQIAKVMRELAEKIVADFVTDYLADKHESWKAPPAKVIPFRRGPR
jgi:hypothetical protein